MECDGTGATGGTVTTVTRVGAVTAHWMLRHVVHVNIEEIEQTANMTGFIIFFFSLVKIQMMV